MELSELIFELTILVVLFADLFFRKEKSLLAMGITVLKIFLEAEGEEQHILLLVALPVAIALTGVGILILLAGYNFSALL